MRRFSYYPGCSSRSHAESYCDSLMFVARRLGLELEEVPSWRCCGGMSARLFSQSTLRELTQDTFEKAKNFSNSILTPCPRCYRNLSLARMEWDEVELTFVLDVLGNIPDGVIERPLNGPRVVAYYGCSVSDGVSCGGSMESILEKVGTKPVSWGFGDACCGGDVNASRPELIDIMAEKIVKGAVESGADCIVVICGFCFSNLYRKARGIIPVVYITELVGVAMGADPERWFKARSPDPRRLLF